jgi:hypothetical protein
MLTALGLLLSAALLGLSVQGQPAPATSETVSSAFNCIVGNPENMGLTRAPTGSGISPAKCISTCQAAGQNLFQVAMVTLTDGGVCWCAKTPNMPPGARQVLLSNCNGVCADGITLGCGNLGPSRSEQILAMYAVRPF